MDALTAVPFETPAGRDASAWGHEQADRPAPLGEPSQPFIERFLVPTDHGLEVVPVFNVDWFEARGNYIRLHIGSVTHDVRKTMRALVQRLDPKQFHRIHRCTIVNLVRIAEVRVRASGDCIVVLQDGQELRMSRAHRRDLVGVFR